MLARLLRLVLVLALVVPPVAAAAQDDRGRAIQLITDANAAYDKGDFRAALPKYREAYSITEDPRVLYRIGLTYENLANYQRAREHLELFLLAEPDSKYAGRVKSKIDNLRKLESTLQAAVRVESTPEGANVWIDDQIGRPVGVTPVRIPVGPGEHTLYISKEGFSDIREDLSVEAGQTVERKYDLEGGQVTETITEPEEPEETTTEETASPVVTSPVGTSHVQLGPSKGALVMSWIAVCLGWAVMATAGVTTVGAYVGPAGSGGGFLLGAVLASVGGYFLWFHDWTPTPTTTVGGQSPPPVRGFGLRYAF